jgi:Peroxisomal membrane protein (Pex16)
VTEGLYSISNLMVLFNDQIIKKQLTKGEPAIGNRTEENIKIFLSVLENVEVLIEISSKKILGDKRKFIIIFIIQAVK